MPFVGEIFAQLKAAAKTPVLQEIRDGQVTGVTGDEFLELIRHARTFLASKGLKKGDRCGLLAANSIRWIAVDLAAMAEGLIVVPLYFRQAPAELIAMMKDSTVSLVCCGDAALREGIHQNWTGVNWPEPPPHFLFDEIFAGVEGISLDRPQVPESDAVTIIYTSGTSGEAKGVVLAAANVGFMLGCTSARLDQLMGGRSGQDRVFHYLPFSFCASWIAVLTFLLRGSLVTLIAGDENSQRYAAGGSALFPQCAQLLERMRRGVDEQIAQKVASHAIYSRAKPRGRARRTDCKVSIPLA
jgi:long-chain acyl-CoA synthetase